MLRQTAVMPLLMLAHYWLWFMLCQTCLRLKVVQWDTFFLPLRSYLEYFLCPKKKKKTLSAVCLFLHHLVGVNQYTAYLDWHSPFMALSLTKTSWQGMSSPCLTPGNDSATFYNAFLFRGHCQALYRAQTTHCLSLPSGVSSTNIPICWSVFLFLFCGAILGNLVVVFNVFEELTPRLNHESVLWAWVFISPGHPLRRDVSSKAQPRVSQGLQKVLLDMKLFWIVFLWQSMTLNMSFCCCCCCFYIFVQVCMHACVWPFCF